MCGINGFNWSSEELINRMNQALKHRGPDDDGTYVDDLVSLGHVRLAIIDLSERGHQPMADANRNYYITYNGEVYNFREIREELEGLGYRFCSDTDTEVVLYAYIEWGERCLERFNGMFAFAVYDLREGKLFLARDRVGVKPLYYYYDGERLIFSSEIPPILVHGLSTEPNKRLIRDFLLYNITDHTDETFFTKINKLPKGHYALFDLEDRTMKLHEWWNLSFEERYSGGYAQAVEALRALLADSVNRRLISDVPVGTCLSGGIDSSAIACLINNTKRANIKTFSAVFPGFYHDETKYIDLVAKETGMSNFKVKPTAYSLKRNLWEFISRIGEPVPTPSPYSQYCVQRLARENGVTVLLDGQGSDELFAGYHYFFGFYFKHLLHNLQLGTFLKELFNLIRGGQFRMGVLSVLFLMTPLFVRSCYFRRKSNIAEELLRDKEARTDFFEKYYTCRSLHEALEFHMRYKLEHLLKWEDRNSMAHSREARVPFLDYRIMEFVSGLPERFIIRGGMTKAILRDAMNGIVPDEILKRRDKIGFAAPEDDWLRSEEMRGLLEEWFIRERPKSAPFIDLEGTRRMIREHLDCRRSHGRALWSTLFLEAWLRVFFDGSNWCAGV